VLIRLNQTLPLALVALSLALGSACSPHSNQPASTAVLSPSTPAERSETQRSILEGAAIDLSRGPEPQVPLRSETETCARFRESLPADFESDLITVPEDWTRPLGKQIQVFYYLRRAKRADGTPAQPVVFFNGGPSFDSHGVSQMLESLEGSTALTFVYIDQRGTGCSDPYPSVKTDAARLPFYGSRAIVQDAEAIRSRVFGPFTRWHAFGQSYGGFIVHRYLEIAPQGLSGAFAHGASVMSLPEAWVASRLRSRRSWSSG
jgi:pimeloyl-ACP methyl ester carboxylesterase